MANFRFFRLNATTAYDGSTALTTAYVPGEQANQPLLSVTQATIGRIDFKKMLRPGSTGALVRVRSWDGSTRSMTLRSVSEAEVAELPNPDVPVPMNLDAPLQTITVTKEWSDVLMVGPSDAATFAGDRGTVEIAWADTTNNEMLRYWNAVASRPVVSSSFNIVDITAGGAVPAWSGLTYFLVNIAGGGVLTVPAASSINTGAQAYFIQVGGGPVGITTTGTDTLNEVVNGLFQVAGFGGGYLARVGAGYVTTEPLLSAKQTVTNNVSGTTQNMPALTAMVLAVELDYTADGDLLLPLISAAPMGAKYLAYRSLGDSQIRLKVAGGQSLNGTLNGVLFVPVAAGTTGGGALVIEAGPSGWTVVGSFGLAPMDVVTVAVGDTTLNPWGLDGGLVRLTEGAGQVVTLPASGTVPVGATRRFLALGAAKTLDADGADTIVGRAVAAAGTFSIPANTMVTLLNSGLEWIVF